ncbi:hypothetical protein MKO06_03780 [Gramella sp. GC03-9]|uniref:Uncharacterized protein n=1 Tax=Christiangramia oceanisediminis TaxID=2920386 RepID=A0A9X2I7B5_9FLAO|nr:hypothetical protein [Gramella oceanisediminis]MCP9199014.1 hypothetical protein [Gramella oceanisediminis]
MKDQNSTKQLTNQEIMELIMNDIERIDIGRFDFIFIPNKSDFTKAMTASIIETCKKLNLRVVQEVEIEMPDYLQKMHKRKSRFGVVDFIIINPNGKDITIELDSSNKLYSYKKLEVAQDLGNEAFWIVWKRNTSGKPYRSSYKDDHSAKNIKLGFVNKGVNIIRHTFHPTIK